MKHKVEIVEIMDPDTLAQDFYHNKQNRADKRQQKWRDKKDRYDEDRDYDS